MKEFKLCYVRNDVAYFTTKKLSEQTGDDWNDVPYEHNAGLPYEPREKDDYEILKIKFDSGLQQPCDCCINSCYSVDAINSGKVA